MNDPHYDGDFEKPSQVGPAIVSIDERTRAKITRSKWWVQAGEYEAETRGSKKRNIDGFLVEQPEPTYVGADVVEYELTHAEVPKPWKDWEPWVYNLQYQIENQISELPIKVMSRVEYRYVHIADPSKIVLKEAFRMYKFGEKTLLRGKKPKADTWILGEDEQLTRWMGDIWEIAARFIFYKGAKFITE